MSSEQWECWCEARPGLAGPGWSPSADWWSHSVSPSHHTLPHCLTLELGMAWLWLALTETPWWRSTTAAFQRVIPPYRALPTEQPGESYCSDTQWYWDVCYIWGPPVVTTVGRGGPPPRHLVTTPDLTETDGMSLRWVLRLSGSVRRWRSWQRIRPRAPPPPTLTPSQRAPGPGSTRGISRPPPTPAVSMTRRGRREQPEHSLMTSGPTWRTEPTCHQLTVSLTEWSSRPSATSPVLWMFLCHQCPGTPALNNLLSLSIKVFLTDLLKMN